jgi:DNA-binding PadR family transcriptional regulator
MKDTMATKNPDFPVRLSNKEYQILELLIRNGEMYGLKMVHESGGTLARGTVYVMLDRMEDKGLIESRVDEAAQGQSGLPRRLYQPTGYGAKVFRQWERLQALAAFAPEFA